MTELVVVGMVLLGLAALALVAIAGLAFADKETGVGCFLLAIALLVLLGFYTGAREIGTGVLDDGTAFENGCIYSVAGTVNLEVRDHPANGVGVVVLIRHPNGKIKAHLLKAVPSQVFLYNENDKPPYVPYP